MRTGKVVQIGVPLSILLLALLLSPDCFAQRTSVLPAAPGLEAMAHPEYLPILYPPGTQTLQFSSYDLSGGNDDGNFDRAFTKYIDNHGEYVLFDAYGPGCLYRQQLNLWVQVDVSRVTFNRALGAGESRIHYYFDDEIKPRFDLSVDEFFGGKHAPFNAPLSFMQNDKRFAVQYYPFPFTKRLKITFGPSAQFKRAKRTDIEGDNYYQFTSIWEEKLP
jgi:hypothetical protein